MITTNLIKPAGQGEPRKLNHVTTGQVIQAPPEPEATKDTDPAKMITTHNIEEHLAKTGADDKPGTILAKDETPVQAPTHKKPGRPRK